MIKSSEDLITQAKQIENVEERTKFISNYLLENVQYDYAYLFAKGYAQGSISAVSNGMNLTINKTKKEEDSEFAIARSIEEGESKIFEDILEIRDRNEGDYDKFIDELRNYIITELKEHIENEEIVEKNADILIQKIEQGLRGKMNVNYNGCELEANYDISKVLIDFLIEPEKFFPPEFENGMITNGVCEHYTNYIVPTLREAGIEAHKVSGTSELGHSWVIVKDNDKDEYKSVDLTRAVFIRDGFKGIPKEQTSEDWIYSDLEDIFKMQKTRSIISIDEKTLPEVIDSSNYDEAKFKEIMDGQEISDNTFRNLVERGLKKGIDGTEVLNSERVEKTKEMEDRTNE